MPVKIIDPSKGIDYYAYLGSNSFTVDFSKPADWGLETTSVTETTPGTMLSGNFQISESDIGFFEHTGRFQWTAYNSGTTIDSKYADISPLFGNLGSATMGIMMRTPSIINPTDAVSFGFYDSGPGYGTLTNQDQSYVYVTPPLSHWMTDLQASNPELLNAPFSVFALPGAHDAGMCTAATFKKVVDNPVLIALLAAVIGVIPAILVENVATRAIINFAITQKDTITTMLNLGTRYFDFRPGYTYKKILPGIYHEHNFIPGYEYSGFLEDVLTWLAANPKEFVVVSLGFAGFNKDVKKPSVTTLNAKIVEAQTATKTTNITIGDATALSQKVSALLSSNTRLIFLNQIGPGTDARDAQSQDSYDGSYETTDVNKIIKRLNKMKSVPPNPKVYTVLQLQGTASGTLGGIFGSIATMSDASSPLMSTKPGFDQATYKWVQTNAGKFSTDYPLVFLNDFADNALATIARNVTVQRLSKHNNDSK